MKEGDTEAATEIEKALKSFVCFLYVGKSYPLYKARPWNDDDFYLQGEHMRTLEILAANKKTELVPIDKIKLAMDIGLVRRPETVMFALAMCARQKKSEELRAGAYYFLAEHCKEWKYFILFIKYASYLCKVEGSKDKGTDKDEHKKPIGWGHGWKNAVNKWYLTKSVTDLADLVTRHKGGHGWTHKDIFKLSHPKTSGLEVEKQAILCYVMKGLEAAEKEYVSNPEATVILRYIHCIKEFKKCTSKVAVVQAIKNDRQKFTIGYVHPMALKHREVWYALLSHMDVRTILNNLPMLQQRGLLTKDGPAIPLIVRALTCEISLKWSQILPADILPVLNRYESPPEIRRKKVLQVKNKGSETTTKSQSSLKGKHATVVVNSQTNDKCKRVRPSKRFIETENPDIRICVALRTALNIAKTMDITKSSNKRYLVSVRPPGSRRRKQCANFGLALTLPLLHRDSLNCYTWPDDMSEIESENENGENDEKDEEQDILPDDTLTIFGYEPTIFGTGAGIPISITKDTIFDDALELLQKLKKYNRPVLSLPFGPLQWAFKMKKPYDVFVNVTNEPPKETSHSVMEYYKDRMKLPDARLINVIIHRVPFELKKEIWNNSLIIDGFDPHVPWIIEAYVRGLF